MFTAARKSRRFWGVACVLVGHHASNTRALQAVLYRSTDQNRRAFHVSLCAHQQFPMGSRSGHAVFHYWAVPMQPRHIGELPVQTRRRSKRGQVYTAPTLASRNSGVAAPAPGCRHRKPHRAIFDVKKSLYLTYKHLNSIGGGLVALGTLLGPLAIAANVRARQKHVLTTAARLATEPRRPEGHVEGRAHGL